MFLLSPDRAVMPALQGIAEEIEKRTPGLYVIAAQQYRYPVVQSSIDLWITEPRRFNMLEEFILRSAVDLNPAPTIDELAGVLGLDQVFLVATFRGLESLNAVSFDPDGRIELTPSGRTYYAEGQVPQLPRKEHVYFLHDSLLMSPYSQKNPLTTSDADLQPLSVHIELSVDEEFAQTFTIDEIREILIRCSLEFHDPGQGRIVTAFDIADSPQVIMQPVSLFLLYDELEQCWALQARKGKERLGGAQQTLDRVVNAGVAGLLGFFNLADDLMVQPDVSEVEVNELRDEDMERFTKINEMTREALRQERECLESPGKGAGDITLHDISILRNEKIRPEFMQLLRTAQKEVIIFSPWITEQVVDDEFISILQGLAARNVWILIGYGINKNRDREERPLPESVQTRIHALRTPQGAPAARVVWLGGSHAKEVVADGKVYLHGSFNWLSYRGDRGVRRETVSKIAIPDIVSEAREEYAGLFLERAYEMWKDACHDQGNLDGLTAICILGTLGWESESLKMLVESDRFDLFPDWIKIVSGNLVHGDPFHGMKCLGDAASLFSDIHEKQLKWDEFRSAWRTALTQLHSLDPGITYELLHHPSWKYYAGLGLADHQNTPDDYLAAIVELKDNVVTRRKK